MCSAEPPTFANDVLRSTSIGEMSAQLVPTFFRSRYIEFVTSRLSKFIGLILDSSIIIRLFLRFTNLSSSLLVSLELDKLESLVLAGRGLGLPIRLQKINFLSQFEHNRSNYSLSIRTKTIQSWFILWSNWSSKCSYLKVYFYLPTFEQCVHVQCCFVSHKNASNSNLLSKALTEDSSDEKWF